MRRIPLLIAGGGPAGSAAAIMLARGGAQPLVIERQRETGDAICGGFLSWRTLGTLEKLGLSADTLGGHEVSRLRLFTARSSAEGPLPGPAIGLSRQRLDTLLLAQAEREGAAIERGVSIRSLGEGQTLTLEDGASLSTEALFVATGKHDLRGLGRPRTAEDPTMGLRIRLPAHPRLSQLVGGTIELHLFRNGYAGLMLQEDGSGNLCMAVRKSVLTAAGGTPEALLRQLGDSLPMLGERLAFAAPDAQIDAIAAVPYGLIIKETQPGLFRLGDQAACIPSLAGEGNGLALASGMAAAAAWAKGGATASPDFQRVFAARAGRPVGWARRFWHGGETPITAALALHILRIAPGLARPMAQLTRIDP